MAWHEMALVALAACFAAFLALASSHAPTLDPLVFEAAFQGRCGEGSPCEQLCRQLRDGTYECGCAPGYVLHVDGYGCLELNATKSTESTSDSKEEVLYQKDASLSAELEDVLYQKDASLSAELDAAPSSYRINKSNVSERHIVNEKRLTTKPSTSRDIKKSNYTYTGERTKAVEGLVSLMEDGVSKIDISIITDEVASDALDEASNFKITTLGPSLEQKVPESTPCPTRTTIAEPCSGRSCPCSSSAKCKPDTRISTPRFSGTSWLALRALRGAYKRVRLRIRVRPERARGVLLLTGEHDDLSGDYLALLLRNGHVELRFDCGSGAGVLRSPEPARLGRWNTVSVYRHRWDAWLRLNSGKRVRGRSKGLFSRMTFREPVWVGGPGNTTGLQSKLGLSEGLLGCVDFLRINGDTYRLVRDAVSTLDIAECAPTLPPWNPLNEVTSETAPRLAADVGHHAIYDINDIVHFEDNDIVMRDSKDHNKLDNTVLESSDEKFNIIKKMLIDEDRQSVGVVQEVDNSLGDEEAGARGCACQHGGACVARVCLCPLGYAGDRCQVTLDLKMPRFNGSSYLRLPGLGSSAQSWLDIQITVKPASGDGLLLYDAERPGGRGDFFSLHLRDYFVEFAFDLGSGIALVRSAYPLQKDAWHVVSVSRAGRRASLRVRPHGVVAAAAARSVLSRGAARYLTLSQPMLLGGAPQPLPQRLALATSFSGCVGKLVINDEELAVVAAALGGVNVDNCEQTRNDSCGNGSCTETSLHTPVYPDNITAQDVHHAIVPKKGFKLKYHKSKSKKHHSDKRKKYIATKKHQHMQNAVEKSDGTATPYDGQTYVQVKHVRAGEINWGDTSSYPSFSGTDSFIHIDDEETAKRLRSGSVDVNVRFRARAARGLLLWSGSARADFLSLAVEDSVLVFRYDLGSGEVVIIANHTKVDDGLWHRARATRNRQAGVLEVDGLGSVGKMSPGQLKQLNTDNGLYIGGLPSIEMATGGRYARGLEGCVSQISLSGDFDIPLSLSKLPHTITNNVGRCAP